MDTILTIISMGLVITALVLCFRAWRGLRAVSKTQPCAVDKLSILAHRREELERASMAWLYSRERGLTNTERREEQVMDRLEREVAELEDELFGVKEEELIAPKSETPKPTTIATYGSDGVSAVYYQSFCRLCGWSWLGRSKWIAEENSAEHERSHV